MNLENILIIVLFSIFFEKFQKWAFNKIIRNRFSIILLQEGGDGSDPPSPPLHLVHLVLPVFLITIY